MPSCTLGGFKGYRRACFYPRQGDGSDGSTKGWPLRQRTLVSRFPFSSHHTHYNLIRRGDSVRRLFIPLLLIIAACAGAVAQSKSIRELKQMFVYDRSLPLDVRESEVEVRDGVRIHDISYQSPKGGRVTAYLVVPAGPRRKFAAVIFMHPRPGSRKNFLAEALALAKAGAVSLLIDAPFSRDGESKREFDPTVTKPEADRDIYIQTVIDFRRGVDLLLSRSDVDAKRIGFVGHSYGAHTGAILAAVEKRIRAYVIMAGAPSLTEFLRTSTIPAIVKTRNALTKGQQENYFKTLAAVDPINYISHVAPAALFLQFGKTDHYPTEENARVYSERASKPKLIKFYEAGHALNDEAKRDRAAWLRERLGLR